MTRILKRTEYGLPAEVLSSNGTTPRPPLALPVRYLTYHYTGVSSRTYKDAVVGEVIRGIHYNWMANEYNYVIGQQDDGLVYEFAGLYRGAHSGGENSVAIGVLFLNAVGEPLTDAQVDKFLWLRAHLEEIGAIPAGLVPTPHTEMPGAETPCPGDVILPERGRLEAPLTAPEPPEEPAMQESDFYLWRHEQHPEVFLIGGGGVVHVTPKGFQHWKDRVPYYVEVHDDAYARYLSAAS